MAWTRNVRRPAVPTYYAAVRLELRNNNLNPNPDLITRSFNPFKL